MYWQGYDVILKSCDLDFGGLQDTLSTIYLAVSSNLGEMVWHSADTILSSIITTAGSPLKVRNTTVPSLIWREYNLDFESHDLNWGAVRISSDTVPPITSNVIEINSCISDSIIPSVPSVMTIHLPSDDILNPHLITTTDILNQINSYDSLIPILQSQTMLLLNKSESVIPSLISLSYVDGTLNSSELLQLGTIVNKFIKLENDQNVYPVLTTETPLISLKDIHKDIEPSLSELLEVGLASTDTPIPTIVKTAYIESNTGTSDILYPLVADSLLTTYSCVEDAVVPLLDDLLLIEFSSSDILYVGIITDAEGIPLKPTYLRFLSDTGWSEKTIYVKQSNGLWSAKSIYMKQIDKSWM